MSAQPLVSVLINNYNYDRYLNDAIESALSQTYPNVEVIVVDDGSTDGSRELLRRYDGRINTLLQVNRGQAAAFNSGFAHSRGEIIAFLDADDVFLPHKLARVVEALHPSAELGWCVHPLQLFSGASMVDALPTRTATGSRRLDLRQQLRRGKLRHDLPATSGLCFRRSVLERILPMPEDIRITSDNYLKFMAVGLSPGVIISETLARQRLHDANAYTNAPNREVLRARIQLLTATAVRRNFHDLRSFANALAADALSGPGGRDEGIREAFESYLESAGEYEKIQTRLHARLRRLMRRFR